VEAGHVERILELLRGMADFVIVDTPPRLDDIVLTALDHSDAVLAVATLDVPSIKNIRIAVQKLKQLGLADGRVRLVLNRADSKVGLEAAEVKKATGCDIVARVPSDRLVPRSVNRGTPVVLDEPKSPVAKSLVQLAEKIVKAREAAAKKPAGQVSTDVA
jgi:pilus assembly protein CpaE